VETASRSLYGADFLGGDSRNDCACEDISRDHGARPDDGTWAYGHTGQNDAMHAHKRPSSYAGLEDTLWPLARVCQ